MKAPRGGAAAIAAAGLLLGAFHAAASLRIPVGAASDDALFLLLARNLLKGSYSIPETGVTWVPAQLPGLPVLLAGPVSLVSFVSFDWSLFRFPMLLFSVLFVFFSWRLALRLLPPAQAAGAALLIGLNRVLVGHAGTVLPDIPFAALGLALFEGLAAGASPALLACGAAAACLFRPHGLLLTAALAWGLSARKGRRQSAIFFIFSVLPWALWSAAGKGHGSGEGFAGLWSAQAGRTLPELFSHAGQILSRLIGQGCFGSPWSGPGGALWALAGLALAASALKDRSPWIKAAGLYCALILALHLTWGPIFLRYALPAAPLLALLALKGLLPRVQAPGPFLAVLAAGAFLQSAPLALEGVRKPAREPLPATMAWLRAHCGPGDRVETLAPFSVNLWTGIQTRFPAQASSPERWRETLAERGITYVHASAGNFSSALPGGGSAPRDLAAWAAGYSKLEPVFGEPSEGARLYRVNIDRNVPKFVK